MSEQRIVVNKDEVEAVEVRDGARYEGTYKILTPAMREPGRLGMCLNRVPPGRTMCPLHSHQIEDEIFYILSGVGALRYGDALYTLCAGDTVSCPAGSGHAHQLANTGDEDLVYLAIGRNDPNEVCAYPDSGHVMVRSLQREGRLVDAGYMDGEPEEPLIFELARGAQP